MKCLAISYLLLFFNASTANASLRRNDDSAQENRVLQAGKVGTYLIKDTEYEGYNVGEAPTPGDRRLRTLQGNKRSERTHNIELSDGTIWEIKNGPPAWAQNANIASGDATIEIPAGAVMSSVDGTIDMKGNAPKVVLTGNGKGNPFGRYLQEQQQQQQQQQRAPAGHEQNLAALQGSRRLQTTGTKSVLAVRVFVSDKDYDYRPNPVDLSNDIHDTTKVTLAKQYNACSYGKVSFIKASDRVMSNVPAGDTRTTNINNGVVDVFLPSNTLSQGDATIRNAVSTKLNQVFGVSSPSVLANHVMYCLPTGAMSGIAYAYINSWNSVFSNEWCSYVSGQMHEIGHNLNYAHSNEGTTTYADQTGMMGYSYGSLNTPVMCFNAAKSWQTGWYSDKSLTINTNTCWEGQLHGIASYGGASSTVLVKINSPTAPDFFVNYNQKTGINSGTVEGGNQVTVVGADAEGTVYAESNLVAKLSAGGTWEVVDAVYPRVKVLSIDTAGGYATVQISQGNAPCPGSPTGSPTPAPPTSSPSTRPPTPPPTPPPTVNCSAITSRNPCRAASNCAWSSNRCNFR